MSIEFPFDEAPFNLLDAAQRRRVVDGVDLAIYADSDTIIAPGAKPDALFVVARGLVEESEARGGESQVIAQYRDGECFGSLALLRGAARHRYAAGEETICQCLDGDLYLDLVRENQAFGEFFHASLATRHKIVAQSTAYRDQVAFSLARADSRIQREVVTVPGTTQIHDAVRTMRERQADCLLVEGDERIGIVTNTDLLDALALAQRPLTDPVAPIASYDLARIDQDDYLFDALIQMTRRRIERIVVFDGDAVTGIVELTDILSLLSSHSHIIALQLERAADVDALVRCADALVDLAASLLAQQVPMRFIMDLLAVLNRRIIARLYELVIAPSVREHSCLLVLGSEGRGEQVMRTDQNNALILADELEWPAQSDDLARFCAHLENLGYPHSPSGIMVANPAWVMSQRKWSKRLQDWTDNRDDDSLVGLCAFLDAYPAGGRVDLYEPLRAQLLERLPRSAVFFRQLVHSALTSDGPPLFFSKLTRAEQDVDIKSTGIFPIVHGVRVLVLEAGLRRANTFRRIDELVERQVIERQLGDDLGESLSLFTRLRLQQQIARHESSDAGPVQPELANRLHIAQLGRAERDLLRGALRIVQQFRDFLAARW